MPTGGSKGQEGIGRTPQELSLLPLAPLDCAWDLRCAPTGQAGQVFSIDLGGGFLLLQNLRRRNIGRC